MRALKVNETLNDIFKPKDVNDPHLEEKVDMFRDMLRIIRANPDTYQPETGWAKELDKPGRGQYQMMDLYYKYYLWIEKTYIGNIFDDWQHIPSHGKGNKWDATPVLKLLEKEILNIIDYFGIKKLI